AASMSQTTKILVMSFAAGALLIGGAFWAIKYATHLPAFAVLGKVLLLIALLSWVRVILGPPASNKALRNLRLMRGVTAVLFGIALLLFWRERNSFAEVLLVVAVLFQIFVVRRAARKLHAQLDVANRQFEL